MIVTQNFYPDEFFPFVHQSYYRFENVVSFHVHYSSEKIYGYSVGVWKPKNNLKLIIQKIKKI